MHLNATAAGDDSSATVGASMLPTPRYPGQNGARAQQRHRPVAPRIRGGNLVSNSRRRRFPRFRFLRGLSRRVARRKSHVANRSRIGRRAGNDSQAAGRWRLELDTSRNAHRKSPIQMGEETWPLRLYGDRAAFRGARHRSQFRLRAQVSSGEVSQSAETDAPDPTSASSRGEPKRPSYAYAAGAESFAPVSKSR